MLMTGTKFENIAFVPSDHPEAAEAHGRLTDRYRHVAPDEADVIGDNRPVIEGIFIGNAIDIKKKADQGAYQCQIFP